MTVDANGGEKQVRIDRTNAVKSLLLTKPTMEEHHKGKKRIDKGSWEYNLMLKWIQGGAKGDVEATGNLTGWRSRRRRSCSRRRATRHS